MTNYKKYAQLIKAFSLITIIFGSIIIISKWFFPIIYEALSTFDYFNSSNFSLLQKTLGFLVDAISFSLIIYGSILLINLMNQFLEEDFFSSRTISLLHNISKIALYYVIFTPIQSSLLSIITSLNNAPGNRIVSLTIGSTDFINLIILFIIYIILTILQRGYSIKHEQDLTI